MEKKIVLVIGLVLFIMSANMEGVASDASDCLDACYTGCVNPDTRLMQRCEGKCRIKCGPDLVADEHLRQNSAAEHP